MNRGRRQFAAAAAGACVGLSAIGADRVLNHARLRDRRKPESRVAVIEADSYEDRLAERLLPSIQRFIPNVLGRSILIKPNLVEDLPGP